MSDTRGMKWVSERAAREEARKLKARIDRVVVPLGKKGKDLTPALADI